MRPTRRPRLLPTPALAMGLAVTLAAAGCEEKRHLPGDKAAAPARPAEDTFIVGQRTQDVGKLDRAADLKKGGQVSTTAITAKDPITLPGNAYVSMIGKTSILKIEHAMNLYKAANDRYPKDYDEFMTEVIRANNIALPRLPHYQKYAYDENEHKLVVMEYPELKNNPAPAAGVAR